MPGTLDDLSFTVWPPAIDISTPANQQVFSPQFGVTNTSASETISLTHALLLVPVTTTGTNLAQNTDMTPNAITSGWQLSRAAAPPNDPGYAAFALLPVDGIGAIAPGGSVAFTLIGVSVNTVAGAAVLRLQAKTSAGAWTPTYPIQLTTPGTAPTFTRHGITPGNPQTLITLQGQAVVLSWTTTGAAYCVIEDDQGNKWDSLPTSGTISDMPSQGNSPVLSTPKLGLYYDRTYHFYAFAADAKQSDDQQDSLIIQLPTVFSSAISPASITPGQSVTVSWSVANIDPDLGKITLTFDPADGTGTYTIAIPPNQLSGSGVVTPTPQSSTTYTLTIDNGYGLSVLAFPPQQVTSPRPAGWQEINSLETLPIDSVVTGPGPMGLVAFASALWCWTSSPSPAALYRTSDGVSWTTETPKALPPLDGMLVADLGDGEKLWAFGANPPFLASSSDGINWVTLPAPPYAARYSANYVADNGAILVLGGQNGSNPITSKPITDVWSTGDGRSWTEIGNDFPGFALLSSGHDVARFAGNLQTVGIDANNVMWGYSSSDGGKTWSRTTTAIPQSSQDLFVSLLPLGDVLLLLGVVDSGNPIPNTNQVALVMDNAGTWSVSANLSPPIWGGGLWSAAVYQGCLSVAVGMIATSTLSVFRLNQILPGTAFTLTPTGNSASE